MTFDPEEIRERWRIDLSDEHIYRLDAVSKGSDRETVCEFKRGSARADAHRVMDALSRVEAQDKEIEGLRGTCEVIANELEGHVGRAEIQTCVRTLRMLFREGE